MILLDLLMPGMNGFAFLEETAKRAEWQDIPIVILTAMPLDAAERALLAGRTTAVAAGGRLITHARGFSTRSTRRN